MNMQLSDVLALPEKVRRSVLKQNTAGSLVMYSYHYVDYQLFQRHPLLQECRGVIFDQNSGELVSRPFHKFYNLGEPLALPETHFAQDTWYASKIDGYMVQAYLYQGELCFSSRKNLQPPMVGPLLQSRLNPLVWEELQSLLQEYGPATLLMELVDPSRPVLFLKEPPGLHLLAIRRLDGSYLLPYRDIPPTRYISSADWQPLLKPLHQLRQEAQSSPREGFVVCRGNDFLKLKSALALQLSQFLKNPAEAFTAALLETRMDDLLASLESRPDLAQRVSESYQVWNDILQEAYQAGAERSELPRKEIWAELIQLSMTSDFSALYLHVARVGYENGELTESLNYWILRHRRKIQSWLEGRYLTARDLDG